MFIVFGTRGLKHIVKDSPVLSNSYTNNPILQLFPLPLVDKGGYTILTRGRTLQKVVRADVLPIRSDTLRLRSDRFTFLLDILWGKSDRLRLFCDRSMGSDPKKGSSNYLFNPSDHLCKASKYYDIPSSYLIEYFELWL